MELLSLSEKKLILLLQVKNNSDEIYFFHEQPSEQNRDLREAHIKSLYEMEELKRFQGSTFDEFSRRRLIENQDTIIEFTAKIAT